MTGPGICSSRATRILILVFAIVGRAIAPDVEVLEFEDELNDPEFICHWSIWTDRGCIDHSGGSGGMRCRAELRQKCVCLKFANKPPLKAPGYQSRTCNYGTLQNTEDKADGRCDSNCQLLDAFFRRLEGMDGAWCPWSDWQQDTCKMGTEGLLEGYQHSFRQCLCPPPWQEGNQCLGSDSRSANCRSSLSDMSSAFLTAWQSLFSNAIVGLAVPLPLIAWFCCLAGPLRRGVQHGRLQSSAVTAELRALRDNKGRRQRRWCRVFRGRVRRKESLAAFEAAAAAAAAAAATAPATSKTPSPASGGRKK